MNYFQEQINLYREKLKISKEFYSFKINTNQWLYIKRFLKDKYFILKTILVLMFFIILIEISIPLFFNKFLQDFSFNRDANNFLVIFLFLIATLVIYLFLSFFNIKFQKKIILEFINFLRRSWVKYYLSKNVNKIKNQDRGKLLVKISYHFSLLQLGLTSSFFSVFEWLFLTAGTLIVSLTIDTKLLIISSVMLFINLFVFYLGYIISMYYVSQDQTLYSKILQYISDVFGDIYFNKMHHRSNSIIKNLDTLVEIDTYFRVRREILQNFGNKIIFVLLIVVSAFGYLFKLYLPDLIDKNLTSNVVYIFVLILLSRLLYLSLRIGIFYFPLKLGLILSVPKDPIDESIFNKREIFPKNLNKIEFHSRKFRFSKNLSYQKDLSFVFEKGKRYLITGPNMSGKSLLANIFCGTAPVPIGKPWVLKINDSYRLLYQNWCRKNKSIYYVNPHFASETTVYEILKNGEATNLDVFEEIRVKLNKYKDNKIFDFIFSNKKFLDQYVSNKDFSFSEIAIIQILYCIVNKVDFIIVDNLWLDMDNSAINEVLKILSAELSDSVIVNFSTKNSNILEYDKTYNI
jgi:ABC-type multidrug transport system fused ATPase/permease subunit